MIFVSAVWDADIEQDIWNAESSSVIKQNNAFDLLFPVYKNYVLKKTSTSSKQIYCKQIILNIGKIIPHTVRSMYAVLYVFIYLSHQLFTVCKM